MASVAGFGHTRVYGRAILFRSYVLFAYLFSGVHALNAISRRSAHVKVGFHFPLTIHAIV